jgi:hypothetical protein
VNEIQNCPNGDLIWNAVKHLAEAYDSITFRYEGSNDDGMIDLEEPENEFSNIEEDRLIELMNDLLDPGWETNEGCWGYIIIDLKDPKITLTQTILAPTPVADVVYGLSPE